MSVFILMVVVFVLGYLAIALEHPIRVDKAASALLIAVLGWVLFVIGGDAIVDTASTAYQNFIGLERNPDHHGPAHFIAHELRHHLGEISEIIFFLLGAMTIVELIDEHEGFSVITDRIKTTNKVKLIWIICILTFFFSALLDNLTTSIVMISLLRRLIADQKTRWFFAGLVVIAANAGGAWSPIGDVTTTMLWIQGQISAPTIIYALFLPSLACLLLPLLWLTFRLKGEVHRPDRPAAAELDFHTIPSSERNLIFTLGISLLLFVPVFKESTHLPPYMGMLFGLGVLWVTTEILHRNKATSVRARLTVVGVLKKVDISSVLFFLGILVAIASLQSAGHLDLLAASLKDIFKGNVYAIDLSIGLLSSIVDNVPLVAGAQGMYQVVMPAELAEMGSSALGWSEHFVKDGRFWEFLAYCAGTGGSALIIGSAAGVAVMGLERIDFIWYLKKISLLAILGYFAGAAVYILMQ